VILYHSQDNPSPAMYAIPESYDKSYGKLI